MRKYIKPYRLDLGEILLDPEDRHLLDGRSWWANRQGYAVNHYSVNNRTKMRTLHRMVMGNPSGLTIDHINFNKLDNRKANLRAVSNQENCRNRPGGPSSKYPCVYFDKTRKKYIAYRDKKYFGWYDTEEAAAVALGLLE